MKNRKGQARMPTKLDFDLVKGETFSYRVVIRDSDGNFLNLSGYSTTGYAKYNYCNSGYILNLNPTIYSTVSGSIDLLVHWTGTTGLPVTKLPYSLNIYNGSTAENVFQGNIYVYPGTISTIY